MQNVRNRIAGGTTWIMILIGVSTALSSAHGFSLNLESPFGNEQWLEGFHHRIAWETDGWIENVRLEYSADGGNSWTDIGIILNVGYYEWLVPSLNSDQCRIRISDAGDPSIRDISDLFSTIIGDCDRILNYARNRIFERTISGMRAADSALGEIVSRPECAGIDRTREAQFLHALTRIAMLGVADDSSEPISILEGLRRFGLELVGDRLEDVDFTHPTNNHDYYEIPAGAPDFDAIQQIIQSSTVAEIDAILDELNRITDTPADRFQILFLPEETGQSNPIEVDFAEVMILKSALKWAKGLILAESAYDLNMTEADRDLLAKKIYGDAVSINLDLLNKYPDFLKVLPTAGHPEIGKTILADARQSLLEAIQDCLDTMAYMESETDPQEDDLLYIDETNLREVHIVRQRMTILQNSLTKDTSSVFTAEERRSYRVNDPSASGRIWYLEFDGYDMFDRPTEGEFWTEDWSVPSYWVITSVDIDGNHFLLEMDLAWDWGSATLEGTFNADKTQIIGAIFDYWTWWSGDNRIEGLSGPQTARETFEVEINLNPIFGSTGRYPNPVSPRNMLPSFTDWNWALPNTMGAGLGNNPTLGGVLPDMTQADWNDAFHSRPASAYPIGIIEGTVQFDEWTDEPIYIEAYTDPGDSEGSDFSHTMISKPGAFILKGITPGETVYVRAYVPLFGFKIFELSAFEMEARAKVEMTSNKISGVNLTLHRPIIMENNVWYSGSLNSELAFRDYYRFEASKGRLYSFQLDTSDLPTAMLLLYGRDGDTQLVQRSRWQTREIVDWICPVDGWYYVKAHIREWNPWQSDEGNYRIRMIVPTSDINHDGYVNMEDLAMVAKHWLDIECLLANDFCEGTDLDHNETIDVADFLLIGSDWMKSFGSLRVTIRPQGAVDAGARWRRVGTTTWFNSGDTENGIDLGAHTIEFLDVEGWNTPDDQEITIANQTANAIGIYTPKIPEGLIALWTMDDNAANTTVLDSGDNHFNGTAQRNTSAMTTSGRIDSALAFNGTTDQIDCGTNTALLPDAWTVCAWVKCANVGTPTLLSFGGIRPSIKLQNNNGGRPAILMASNNYRTFEPSAWTTLKDGQWHHVAFTLSGSAQSSIESGQMYLDGVAVSVAATVATGPQTAKSRVFLGNSDAAGSQPFQGAMDDVMLFNRVLSADEIQQVMNRTP